MKKKILIPYASYGSGHKAIAKYIEEYFLQHDPELEIKTVDLLEYSMPIIGPLSQKINGIFMLKVPFLHNLTYKSFDTKLTGAIADNVSLKLFKNSNMKSIFKDFNPDLTIATHFFGSSLVTYYNKKGITNSKLITVVTDYEAHELWMRDYKTDDYIVVGDVAEVPALVKRGIEREKIKPIGIPIAPKSKEEFNREKSLNKYNLSGLKPICVFFGGGGNGSTASIPYIKRILKSNYNMDIIFISGRNQKSKEKVEHYVNTYNLKNVRVLGFVDNVPELLQLCDFVISKPGGGQVTECLYYNKPVLMINSSGGQEIANYKLFTKSGYGKWFRNPWSLNHYVNEVLKNPKLLTEMSNNMKKMDNTTSIDKLYILATNLLKDK